MAFSRGFLIRAIGFGGWLVRAVWWPWLRVQIVCDAAASDPRVEPRRRILCLWHENLLVGLLPFTKCNLKVLVSQSKDGEAITSIIEALGFSTVRGSSQRGGAQAVREMLRAIDDNCIAITPDGPKGPRREMKDGVTFLGSRAEVPITPLALAFGRAYFFRSWDQMAFPWFATRIVIYLGPALMVPRSADKEDLERFTRELQQRMDAAHTRAPELLAEWERTGKRPAAVDNQPPAQLKAAA